MEEVGDESFYHSGNEDEQTPQQSETSKQDEEDTEVTETSETDLEEERRLSEPRRASKTTEYERKMQSKIGIPGPSKVIKRDESEREMEASEITPDTDEAAFVQEMDRPRTAEARQTRGDGGSVERTASIESPRSRLHWYALDSPSGRVRRSSLPVSADKSPLKDSSHIKKEDEPSRERGQSMDTRERESRAAGIRDNTTQREPGLDSETTRKSQTDTETKEKKTREGLRRSMRNLTGTKKSTN